MKKKIEKLSLVFILMLIISACNFGDQVKDKNEKTPNQNQQETKENDLRKAPQFEVTTIDGKKLSLQKSIEEDKPIIIYFTASWCPMCAQNWPALEEVYPEFKERINLVAISIDPTDDKAVMSKLAEDNNLNFPISAGKPQVMLDFGVESQANNCRRK